MTPHDEYIQKHIDTIKALWYERVPTEILSPALTTAETIDFAKEYRANQLIPMLEQIYQDGYSDGYDERQALGDLNPPQGGVTNFNL